MFFLVHDYRTFILPNATALWKISITLIPKTCRFFLVSYVHTSCWTDSASLTMVYCEIAFLYIPLTNWQQAMKIWILKFRTLLCSMFYILYNTESDVIVKCEAWIWQEYYFQTTESECWNSLTNTWIEVTIESTGTWLKELLLLPASIPRGILSSELHVAVKCFSWEEIGRRRRDITEVWDSIWGLSIRRKT
jgi:hypothetical protein